MLTFRRGALAKRVYLRDGRIVFATSSDPNERLGELLLREGMITLDQLDQAISRIGSGKRLGTLLVEAGHLTPHNLVRGVISQVKDVVLGLFPWEEGEYVFDEGPLPTEEVITLNMHTGELLRQGIRRIRALSRMRASVGGSRSLYRIQPGWEGRVEGMSLTEGERLLLRRLRGDGATVEALCREVFLSNFEIYQTIWAFKITGVVEQGDRFAVQADPGRLEGRLGTGDVPGLLVRLCRAGETGLLHVSQGTRERTFHLREGRCVFATSNSLDDGLVSYLLRRGVISLRDRDEVARRLLSNKRVGSILLEMGVLDEADLVAMVSEHLLEIVHATFPWEEGDWAFLPGELPTLEEITLDTSLEQLVTEGISRIGSWSRVREGAGGADAVLRLTPDYLAVLDRMKIGSDEWEIVSSLREPKTIRELCRTTTLGDFRVCQLLWSLRLLGAVREGVEEQPEVSGEAARTAPPAPLEEAAAPVAAATFETDAGAAPAEAEEASPVPMREEQAEPAGLVEPAPLLAAEPAPELEEAPVEVVEAAAAPPSPDATLAIPREEIEATLHAGPRDLADETEEPSTQEVEVESTPVWEPPPGLDKEIARFNDRHRTLYRVIRSEVGAGAGNFVKSCRGALVNGLGNLLGSVELQPDGTWDERGLRRVIVEGRVEDPCDGFLQLLEREIERLRAHIGEARAQALREKIQSPEPGAP